MLHPDYIHDHYIKITALLTRAVTDIRITSKHVLLYLVLLDRYYDRKEENYIRIFAKEIMPIAQVSSTRTYHRLIRDLHEFGIIQYQPSFNNQKGSKIFL